MIRPLCRLNQRLIGTIPQILPMNKPQTNWTLWVISMLLAWQSANQLVASAKWGHESWQMSEWLINYAGGFVRRGLAGELIFQTSAATGWPANLLVVATSFACYLILLVWLLRKATYIFPPILILSCVVMGIPGYQESIVRKDCLGLLIMLALFRTVDSKIPAIARFITINLLAAVAIFIHEAFFFYALPAWVLFRKDNDSRPFLKAAATRAAWVLPAAVCFGLSAVFHGNPATSRAVNESLIPLWRMIDPHVTSPDIPMVAIEALGWTSSQGLSLALGMLTSGIYQPAAWACVYAISFGLVVLFTGKGTIGTETAFAAKCRFAAIALTQLACISPLFILGFDYGRWLFFWITSSMMLHTLGYAPPCRIEHPLKRVSSNLHLPTFFTRTPAKDWYLLLFGVPVCWNAMGFLTASPLGRHLWEIWKLKFK